MISKNGKRSSEVDVYIDEWRCYEEFQQKLTGSCGVNDL
ncbi:hypothetical protein T4A_8521 [Trichinella pseudospiralis]|uniref:Uncharacterized protein n=1 Tax=Trichinella pseudospiralis TaxID=6337 RepID=A0A0V1DRK4_TRIPS|nr:hypothetical protein T4A_4971 [Trichinella pseudospiralis]KRY64191.1 hypothetical protein T4A_8521 [Trichinella pseudospiralis]